MSIVTKDVKTLVELKSLDGQEGRSVVMFDASTGEPFALDMEVLINLIKRDGTNSNLSVLNFNTESPLVDVSIGAVRWNSEDKILQYRVSDDSYIDVGEEVQYRAKNADDVTLTNGHIVYVYGSTGENLTIKRASNTNADTARRTIGIVTEGSIGQNANGRFTIIGAIHGLNTSAYAAGTILYLGVNGSFTGVKPEAPIAAVRVGIVLRSHATEGIIYFNAQTVEAFGDLSDVHMPIKQDGDTNIWDAANGRFVRFALSTALESKQSISNLSNDIITDAASTTKYPSVKEIKDYADGLVVGLMDDRGNYNASLGVYPSTGGSGAGGAVLKGDIWFISVAGTIDSHYYEVGDSVRALVDNPAQVSANWGSMNSNLTYVPEDVANKKTEISESDQHYPSNGAVSRHVAAEKVSIIESLTGQIDGGVPSSVYGGCGVVDGGSPSTIF